MLNRRRKAAAMGFTTLALALVATGLAIGISNSAPYRWDEPLIGIERNRVHLIIGYPDGNFIPKGWDGWSQPALVGAWVLIAHYDEDEVVTRTNKKFVWGFAHRRWAHDYRTEVDLVLRRGLGR